MIATAVIGVDVGGTRIKSAVVDASGAVLDEATVPTPDRPGDAIGALVARIVAGHRRRLSGGASAHVEVAAVGVVVPGIVDDRTGTAHFAANLGWRDLPLGDLVAAHVPLPLAVGHDVRAGLVAEHRFGAARDARNVLFLPLGTGIASAVMADGHLLTDPWSGEIGHVVVDPQGRECGCGTRGCLETVASARAIGDRYAERTGLAADAAGLAADAAEVARRVAAGASAPHGSTAGPDEVARRVWDEAVQALAVTLAPVVAALGTNRVLVGGGLVRSGETLLAPLRRAVTARLGAGVSVDVRAAALGDRAGCLGAAALAMDVSGAVPLQRERPDRGEATS